MRVGFLIILLAVCAGVPSSVASDLQVETDHLVLRWEEDALSEEGLEMAKAKGERFYAAIQDLLGYEPPSKILISLEGPAQRPDGSWAYPRVDGWGRIHLYQFAPSHESYFNALAHEMVHVFRLHRRPHHDWFLEEGFAEFVALRVDPSLDGFPWYGFPVDVVAGQWIAGGDDIPLTVLQENHKSLNLPCKAQSYSLRSAFFHFLGETYGDERVLELATQERAGALADYSRFFGKEFEVLEKDWREALVKAYDDIEGVDALARQYREQSPVQYMPVCHEGDDF